MKKSALRYFFAKKYRAGFFIFNFIFSFFFLNIPRYKFPNERAKYRPTMRRGKIGAVDLAGKHNPGMKLSRAGPARQLTAVVGGRAALSFPHDRAAALERWRARKRNAPYGAHRAETIVARGLPLDVAYHLALGVGAVAHAAAWAHNRAEKLVRAQMWKLIGLRVLIAPFVRTREDVERRDVLTFVCFFFFFYID